MASVFVPPDGDTIQRAHVQVPDAVMNVYHSARGITQSITPWRPLKSLRHAPVLLPSELPEGITLASAREQLSLELGAAKQL